jgi:uncharacterized protein (TIGR00255 family)
MLRSMTGFGRSVLEEESRTQTWEIRSVNNRYLDIKWRLPPVARSLESSLEKLVKRHAARGRVEISLSLKLPPGTESEARFDSDRAEAMIQAVQRFADERGDVFEADYNRLLDMAFLWEDDPEELDEDLIEGLEAGLTEALEDWNEARCIEARALAKDIETRILHMEEWLAVIGERAPGIKEERFIAVRDRLGEMLEQHGAELEEGRFLQEITLLADKMDVSEEITRLNAHLERLRELLDSGADAGRKLDFTIQECFREINTCGNKIQNVQISRLVVDFKNELEKCREQVQNVE